MTVFGVMVLGLHGDLQRTAHAVASHLSVIVHGAVDSVILHHQSARAGIMSALCVQINWTEWVRMKSALASRMLYE